MAKSIVRSSLSILLVKMKNADKGRNDKFVVMFSELARVVANQPQREELKGILDELKNQKTQLDKIMVCGGNIQYF